MPDRKLLASEDVSGLAMLAFASLAKGATQTKDPLKYFLA